MRFPFHHILLRSATLTTTILIFWQNVTRVCAANFFWERMCCVCHFVSALSSIFVYENLHCGKPDALLWVQMERFLLGVVIKHWERGEQLNRLNLSPKARIPKLPKLLCGYSKMRAIMFQPAAYKLLFEIVFSFNLFCHDKQWKKFYCILISTMWQHWCISIR